MDNKEMLEEFVSIVIDKANEKIKVDDVLPILQVVSKSIDDSVDVQTVNTIILGIITGLATILDGDKTDKILDDYIKDLKDSLA